MASAWYRPPQPESPSPLAPTAAFKELLDALEAAVRAKASDYGESVHRVALDEANEAALRASRKALEDYVAGLRAERDALWAFEGPDYQYAGTHIPRAAIECRNEEIRRLRAQLSSLRSSQITAEEARALSDYIEDGFDSDNIYFPEAYKKLRHLAGEPIEGK